VPLDEIYLLCIKRSIDNDIRTSILIGVGTVLADCLFILLVSLKIPVFTYFFVTYAGWIQRVAGLFLVGLGIYEVRHTLKTKGPLACLIKKSSILWQTFLLELANPVTIAVIISIYDNVQSYSSFETLLLVSGVFISVVGWWSFMGLLICYYRKYFSPKFLHILKLITSIALVIIGIIIAWVA